MVIKLEIVGGRGGRSDACINVNSTLSKSSNIEYLWLYIQTDDVYFDTVTGLPNHM